MFQTWQGRSKSFHLSVNHMTIGKEEKGQQQSVQFINHDQIDKYLNDMSYNELIGYHHSFNTLAFAITTVDKLQDLEELQPKLAWKPLEVIRQTLQATTQWAVTLNHYPLKGHNVSQFPWANRSRLQEDVLMDTVFSPIRGFDGSNCSQVFFGLLSRSINTYHMPSNKSVNIVKAYQDFMRYEGVPAYLH